MVLILALFLGVSAYAKNLVNDAHILNVLGIAAKDVLVEYPREQDPDNENLDKDLVVISARAPLTYMGNALPVGAQIFYHHKQGVTSIANFIKGNLAFEGFTCLDQVKLVKGKLCSCSVANTLKIAKGVELPRRSNLLIKKGKIVWFFVPPGMVEEFSSGFYQKIDEPIVGGVIMKHSKVYSLKNGKVVEQTVQWEHENFCEGLRK